MKTWFGTPFLPNRLPGLFAAAVFLLLAPGFHGQALADGSPVSTHFSYASPNATSVGVAGEFNSWQAAPMVKGTDGNWTADIPLAPGEYAYKFVVNGNDWELDPNTTARKTISGIENSSITVGAAAATGTAAPPATTGTAEASATPATGDGELFTYSNAGANSVFLAGQFNGWSTSATPMQKDSSGAWSVRVPLAPGTYQYKLFVDGAWLLDPANPQQADDGSGNKNSVKVVGNAPGAGK